MKAYRHDNLIYIPITKQASTTYTYLFANKLKWEEIQTDIINWDNDVVFAHLIHPYERHLKGTAEALIKYDLLDLLDNPKFSLLWDTAVFDLHSYPLFISFGDNINKINWILLDHPTISGNDLTVNFLNNHRVDISKNDILILNKSDNKRKRLIEKLKQLRQGHKLGSLTYFYDNDIVLYNKVLIKTNNEY
jgi:hypothetical protein